MPRFHCGVMFTFVGALALGSCGGSPASPSPSASGPVTITVGANGVSPNLVRIEMNQQVRFSNNGSRTVEIHSDPHPTHGGCPPINEVGPLASGQSRQTGAFTRVGTCTYHDHSDPNNSNLRGTILVNVNDPGPPPIYSSGHSPH